MEVMYFLLLEDNYDLTYTRCVVCDVVLTVENRSAVLNVCRSCLRGLEF
jgi:ribosomal protein S14